MDKTVKRGDQLTSELFTVILCDPNFVVSWPRKLIFTPNLSLPLKALLFNVKPKCLQITMLWMFEIYGCARNHGKKFSKYSQTSFSGIVNYLRYMYLVCVDRDQSNLEQLELLPFSVASINFSFGVCPPFNRRYRQKKRLAYFGTFTMIFWGP